MNKLQQDINPKYEQLRVAYLSYYDKVWDLKTYRNEASRAKTIIEALKVSGFNGMAFYAALKDMGYKPYTIKTIVQAAGRIYAHGQKEKIVDSFNNPFKDFMATSKNVFRNAYKPERLKIDFDEAHRRILTIEDENIKYFCLALLQSGLRIHEAYKVDHSTSSVIGKGDKQRFVIFNYNRPNPPSEYAVRKQLTALGLKPHSLRKLLSTKLARGGFSREDLMEIMGWSSSQTADKYNQPLFEEQLREKLQKVLAL
jgi:site-specific recombinase XerD